MDQGQSKMTMRKELEIEGLTQMRMNQFKSPHFKYRNVICADVFCGSGINTVEQEIVDGSPIRILRGYLRATGKLSQKQSLFENMPDFNHYNMDFWFSDIKKDSCEMLKRRIEFDFKMNIEARAMSAKDAINVLGNRLAHDRNTHLYLVVDPNGPKAFPRDELKDLIRVYSKRVDVIPNISATSINRCIGAREKSDMKLSGWMAGIENFDEGFISAMVSGGRKGWIRKPIQGDRWRWTMIPTFGRLIPKNDWVKQGYVAIDSSDGKNAINHYCGGFL